MPLQNRVDPWGQLHAHPAKTSTIMGNRGILHDVGRNIVKQWAGKAWVACDPAFKGIDRRPLFQVSRYSELFFLDEATAYAAGHRPCAYCQRERFNAFKNAWAFVHFEGKPPSAISIKEIDDQLHKDRVERGGKKIGFTATVGSLPDGTIVQGNGAALLLHGGKQLRWAFDGYTPAEQMPKAATVNVLTPSRLVQLFASGLISPGVHASASA